MHSLLSIVVNMSLQLISASVALHSVRYVAYIQFHSVVTDCRDMHSLLPIVGLNSVFSLSLCPRAMGYARNDHLVLLNMSRSIM